MVPPLSLPGIASPSQQESQGRVSQTLPESLDESLSLIGKRSADANAQAVPPFY
jgi:hypothetical protein